MGTKIKVIMFTDCVGAAALQVKLGLNVWLKLRRQLEKLTKAAAQDNGGSVVKPLGDGHLVTFDSAVGAIRAGLAVQRAVAEYAIDVSIDLRIRVGIDVGEVGLELGDDVIGHYADMAKRIEAAGNDLSAPVLFSERVEAILPSKSVEYEERGPVDLKGSPKLVKLYKAIRVVGDYELEHKQLRAHVTGGFFQVLIPGFSLTRFESPSGQACLKLQLKLTDDLPVLTTTAQKHQFFRGLAHADDARAALVKDLALLGTANNSIAPSCPRWPLRYANGGVLPIVRFGGRHYACLFYRDVFPFGWNIANGASDAYGELFCPDRVIKREFGEEFVVVDRQVPEETRLLFYEPGHEYIAPGYQTNIIRALQSEPNIPGYDGCQRGALEVNWLSVGQDQVIIAVANDTQRTSGVYVSITPEDNAIEVDHVAYIRLAQNQCIIDGEVIGNFPLGRVVGMFDLDALSPALAAKSYTPDVLFVNGYAKPPKRLSAEVDGALHRLETHRTLDQLADYQKCEFKFDLCPITKMVLSRFLKAYRGGSVVFPESGD
jgi:class 3 adenylate cyclase